MCGMAVPTVLMRAVCNVKEICPCMTIALVPKTSELLDAVPWMSLVNAASASLDTTSVPSINCVTGVRLGDAIRVLDSLFQDSNICLLYTSPSPRDGLLSRMPSSA